MSAGGFWIIGCGAMAGAMLERWIEAGLEPAAFRVVDPAMPALPGGLQCLPAIPADARTAETVLLGIKPQGLVDAAGAIARLIGPETQLLSILAGVEMATLTRHFPKARITRVMPNLPVRLGKGVIALHAPDGADANMAGLMAPLGVVEWIADEDDFHRVTALSGCGPAFTYRFIDALSAAAIASGMDAAQAARLALATVEGAAALAAVAEASPATLADRVASKGGVTRAGLDVLDDGRVLEELLTETLAAAEARSREMARS